MSGYQPVTGIKIEIGGDTKNITTRLNRGTRVTSEGPQSPLYAVSEVKAGVDAVMADTVKLKAANDDYNVAHAAARKARSALHLLIGSWDDSYHILVASGEKHCLTADDGTGLGLVVAGTVIYTLGMPISVDVKHNVKKAYLRIHVERAPGMRGTSTEITTDPTFAPGSWKELDGDGLVHLVPNPAPGTYWVRAAHKTARAKSDYTTPVSVIVK